MSEMPVRTKATWKGIQQIAAHLTEPSCCCARLSRSAVLNLSLALGSSDVALAAHAVTGYSRTLKSSGHSLILPPFLSVKLNL
jgi:hypothetical protein